MAATVQISQETSIKVPVKWETLHYLPRLIRTIDNLPEGYKTEDSNIADFYDTLKVAAVMSVAGSRIITPSDSGEAHHIYAQKSSGAEMLRNVEEFKDHFGDNNKKWRAWEETLTGLRFRESDLGKPYNVGDKITAEVIETDITPFLSQIADPKFTRDNWKDIIDNVNQVKGELAIPYCRGHVIREMHPVYGIFTEVEPTTEHKAPFALHGWLRKNLDIPQDPISGHYDVAVGRRGYWPLGERCLCVDANCRRWLADSSDGFRPVIRGSVQKTQPA